MKITQTFAVLAFACLFPINAGAQIFNVNIPQNELCLPEESSPFVLDKVWDPIIFGAGAITYGGALLKDHFSSNDDVDDFKSYDKDNVNPFDRFFMNEYSKSLHNMGTATCLVATAGIPFATFLTESACGNFSKQNLFDVAVMYSEALLFTNGIKDWIKIGAKIFLLKRTHSKCLYGSNIHLLRFLQLLSRFKAKDSGNCNFIPLCSRNRSIAYGKRKPLLYRRACRSHNGYSSRICSSICPPSFCPKQFIRKGFVKKTAAYVQPLRNKRTLEFLKAYCTASLPPSKTKANGKEVVS